MRIGSTTYQAICQAAKSSGSPWRALVSNPDVIFADEPMAALDKVSGRNVVDMLKTMGRERGTTTVMVTHDNRILELADRIITLEEGRVVSDVRP